MSTKKQILTVQFSISMTLALITAILAFKGLGLVGEGVLDFKILRYILNFLWATLVSGAVMGISSIFL